MILCEVPWCCANREFVFNSDSELQETFPCQGGFQALINTVSTQTQPVEEGRGATSVEDTKPPSDTQIRGLGHGAKWVLIRLTSRSSDSQSLLWTSLQAKIWVPWAEKWSSQHRSQAGAGMLNGNSPVFPFWGETEHDDIKWASFQCYVSWSWW